MKKETIKEKEYNDLTEEEKKAIIFGVLALNVVIFWVFKKIIK